MAPGPAGGPRGRLRNAALSPGRGFEYCDTGYVVAGILVKHATGQPLHQVYRELVFHPAGMGSTWLGGHEPARAPEVAHHYTDELDWTTISPTIDWAAGAWSPRRPTWPASCVRCDRNGSSALARWAS